MKKTLSLWILSTCVLGWAAAQDATTVLVAPSDQIKYPDASQVLNKTETPPATKATPVPATAETTPLTPSTAPTTSPAPTSGLPTTKPLVTSTPVRPQGLPPAEAAKKDDDHSWFVKWTLTGDESGAQGWVQALGLPATLQPVSAGVWEVWAGPLSPSALKAALRGQAGVATVVRR